MSNDRTKNFDFMLGSHLLVCRGGDTVDGLLVGPEVVSTTGGKPDTSPTTNWTELGTVIDFDVDSKETLLPRYKFVGGKKVLRGNIITDQQMTYMASIQDCNVMFLELLFGIAGKSDVTTGAFQPGTKVAPVTVWAKFQGFNQITGSDSLDMDVWCELTVGKYKFASGKVDNYALTLTQVYSSLNTGAFTI